MLKLAVLVATIVGAGCVLLVDSAPSGDQFSDACAVADPGTACGTCIDTSCGAELSACCGDTSCRDVLASIDACAEAGTCVVDTTNGNAAALESCVSKQCSSTCQIVTSSVYDAGIYCSNDTAQGSCNCYTQNIFGSATTRCDVTTVPNSMCCADLAWPSSGNCACAGVACTSSSSAECMCIFNNGLSTVSSCNQAWGICCTNGDSCNCNDFSTSCDSSSVQVTDCQTVTAVACPSGQHSVSNCSAE